MPLSPRFSTALVGLVLVVSSVLGQDLSGELRVARAFIDSQRYADALKSLKNIIRKAPKNAEARFLSGEIYGSNNQVDRAEENYKRALQLDPTYKDAADKLYEILRAKARTGGAGVYQKALEQGFYIPPMVLELARAYAARRKNNAVLALARRLHAKIQEKKVPAGFASDSAHVLLLAARMAYAKKNTDEAWKYLDQARSQSIGIEGLQELSDALREELKNKATPFRLEGNRYAVQGKYNEALAEYEKALKVFPNWFPVKENQLAVNKLMQADTLYNEAIQLIQAGNRGTALRKIILGLTKQVENEDLAGRNAEIMARLLAKKAELEKEDAARKQAEKDKQRAFATAYQAGEDAGNDGKWIEAARAYKEAVRLFPQNERALRRQEEAEAKAALERTFQQGEASFKSKQYQSALTAFLNVLDQSPDDVRLKRLLAMTYFNLGKKVEAEKFADQVTDVRRDKQMLYILGVIQDERVVSGSASPRTAIAIFEKIENEDPFFEDVAERLSRLRWQKRRLPMLAAAIGFLLWGVMMFWSKYKPTIQKNRFLGQIESFARREKWAALCDLEPQARAYPLDRTQDLAVATALAQAFYHTQQWQKAINWGQAALGLARENPSLISLMGRIYYEAKIISQDILRFLIALHEQEPENVELMRWIGEFCLDKQVINDDTMPVLRSLALVMPQHDKLRRMLIRGYLRNKDRSARALALYRAELQKTPDNYEIRYYVAADSLKAGRVEESIEHCEKILNQRLNHPETHEVMLQAYEKMGKLDELARILQGILENDPYNPAVQDSLKKILAKG